MKLDFLLCYIEVFNRHIKIPLNRYIWSKEKVWNNPSHQFYTENYHAIAQSDPFQLSDKIVITASNKKTQFKMRKKLDWKKSKKTTTAKLIPIEIAGLQNLLGTFLR